MDKVFSRQNRSVILLGFLISACAYPAVLLSAVHTHKAVIDAVLLLGGVANPFVNVTLMTMAAKIFDIGTVGRICGLWMSTSFLPARPAFSWVRSRFDPLTTIEHRC